MGTKFYGSKEETSILNSYITLMRSVDTLTAKLSFSLSKYNLTLSQFGVLEALYHLGPLCQKEISFKVLKSTANITTVLDNLETRELVQRIRQKEDRRFIIVHLTPKGNELIQKVLPLHIQEIITLFKVLEPQEIETLHKITKKLGLLNTK